jgi:hypothetical protein
LVTAPKNCTQWGWCTFCRTFISVLHTDIQQVRAYVCKLLYSQVKVLGGAQATTPKTCSALLKA